MTVSAGPRVPSTSAAGAALDVSGVSMTYRTSLGPVQALDEVSLLLDWHPSPRWHLFVEGRGVRTRRRESDRR